MELGFTGFRVVQRNKNTPKLRSVFYLFRNWTFPPPWCSCLPLQDLLTGSSNVSASCGCKPTSSIHSNGTPVGTPRNNGADGALQAPSCAWDAIAWIDPVYSQGMEHWVGKSRVSHGAWLCTTAPHCPLKQLLLRYGKFAGWVLPEKGFSSCVSSVRILLGLLLPRATSPGSLPTPFAHFCLNAGSGEVILSWAAVALFPSPRAGL